MHAMNQSSDNPFLTWRHLRLMYLLFVLAFPLGLLWVNTRPAVMGPTYCLFRLSTHLDCPACGMTRAFRAMSRLDVRSAFQYNPVSPVVFLLVVTGWGYAVLRLVTGGRVCLPTWWQRWQPRMLTWALAIFLLIGIGRILYEMHHPPTPPIVPNFLTTLMRQ